MSNPILIDFWHFSARLTEWLDQAVINEHQAEIFSCYAGGLSLEGVYEVIHDLMERDRAP